jgi:putative FmdB family regulatory protein
MPIYAYRCAECGHEVELLQKVADAPLTDCPSCQRSSLVKQVTAAGFQLKGSGWYVTDFRGNGSGKAKDGKPADGKSADGKPAEGEAKPDPAKPAETTAAAAKPAESTTTATPSSTSGRGTGGPTPAS